MLMMREAVNREVAPLGRSLPVEFDKNIAVTFSRDGSCLSVFGDDIWDYSSTSTSTKTINFRGLVERGVNLAGRKIDDEITFLKTFTLHWVSVVGGCSMSKLRSDINAISALVCYCFDNVIPLKNIFSTPIAIDYLVEGGSTDKQIGLALGKIQRVVDAANVLIENDFWNSLTPSAEFLRRLKGFRTKFPETSDSLQTLLIPSKIYQNVLKKIIDDLDLYIQYEEKIELVFDARALARDLAVKRDRKALPSPLNQNQAARVRIEWLKLLANDREVAIALKDIFSAGISKSEDWAGLADNLGRWQLRCAFLISAFTGMRKGELLSIPLNGLKSLSNKGREIPVIWSTTTKLEEGGAPHFTKWITGSIVEKAVKVARSIAYGALAWSDDRGVHNIDENEVPLFFSTEHGKKGNPHPRFEFKSTSFNLGGVVQELFRDELEIATSDMAEIDWFMYGENIPMEIKEGGSWPLTFHQFRRSMTVYAAASGKVSYPVLKAQLKHISMVMTVYYSDSNSRAVNILGDESEVKALRKEWVDAKARFESDELFQLLSSRVPLAGSAGKRLRAKKVGGMLPEFLENRKTTKAAVKSGKIRYRPTLVGGCMSRSPCNNGAGVLASACIRCEDAVFLPGSKAALEETKAFYEAELAEGVPKRARQEYEENIRKINIFLMNLIETVEIA